MTSSFYSLDIFAPTSFFLILFFFSDIQNVNNTRIDQYFFMQMQKIEIDFGNGEHRDVPIDWNTGAAHGEDNDISETETQEVPNDGDAQELDLVLVTKQQEKDGRGRPVKYYTISISGTALVLFICCCCLLCCFLWSDKLNSKKKNDKKLFFCYIQYTFFATNFSLYKYPT